MYSVLGHTIAHEGTLPYSGPIAGSPNAAIDAWLKFAVANGEIESECIKAADALKIAAPDTLVSVYGGDEVVCVSQLHLAD